MGVNHMVDKCSDSFREAIIRSLQELKDAQEKISKAKVVGRAKFENGQPVGKSTLWSKYEKGHEKEGEPRHKDLLILIDEAINQKARKSGKPSKKESIAGLKSQIRELKAENQDLYDQIVEQEARIYELDTDVSGKKNVTLIQEEELYVLARIVNELTNACIPDIKAIQNRFELKYRADKGKMEKVSQEASLYLEDVRDSRLVGLSEVKYSPKAR